MNTSKHNAVCKKTRVGVGGSKCVCCRSMARKLKNGKRVERRMVRRKLRQHLLENYFSD